jgi:hypothetical protein
MKIIITVGNWTFELKQIFARKTKTHGDDFVACAVITFVDSVPNIELMLNKHDDKFTKQDYANFKTFLDILGVKNAKFARFKNSVKKEVEKIR